MKEIDRSVTYRLVASEASSLEPRGRSSRNERRSFSSCAIIVFRDAETLDARRRDRLDNTRKATSAVSNEGKDEQARAE